MKTIICQVCGKEKRTLNANVAGFDAAVPNLIGDFVAGRL